MPPRRRAGKNVIAITIIPMPPNHCKNDRHNKILLGIFSTSVKVLMPVVLSEETDSKQASTNGIFNVQYMGSAAKIDKTTHTRLVTKNASRIPSFMRSGHLFAKTRVPPIMPQTKRPATNYM